jgi:2-dehydro-3-deoxy-D-arabinonate dehydratase
MKLVQLGMPGKGRRVGVVRGDRVLDITAAEEGIGSTLDLLLQGRTPAGLEARVAWLEKRLRRKALDWPQLQESRSRQAPHLLAPLDPPEVWGIDGTYADSSADPPLFFFKATAPRCLGPHAAIPPGDGEDRLAPEAELAVVLGGEGALLGVTAGNDLTARGLLRREPGAMTEAKVTRGCCALGPCLVTGDEIDIDGLQIRCAIWRGGEEVFAATANTREVRGGVPALLQRFLQIGRVLPGTVLLTGTGILMPEGQALAEGDRVDVEIQGIGRLSNPVRRPRTR